MNRFVKHSFRRSRQLLKGHKKPRSFDRNLIVIGAGAGGLVSSYMAAAVGAKVSLIERERMGGDCLYTGCVPSKALIRSARLAADIARADALGFNNASAEVDIAKVMQRVAQAIQGIEPHDSAQRYESLGVDCITGDARVTSPWNVEVNGQTLSARHIIIASGSKPLVPPIPGLDQVSWKTSDSIWSLQRNPGRLLVLGGGPIGCELGQAFARLGVDVCLVELQDRLLTQLDSKFSEGIATHLGNDGVDIRLAHKVLRFERRGEQQFALCEFQGDTVELEFDLLLMAIGRRCSGDGFGLEELGIELDRGRIPVDRFMRTALPSVYACGDVTAIAQLTHAASHQAWYASVNALFSIFSPFKRFAYDDRVLPWSVFCDPEVAHVGLTATQAEAQGIDYEITEYDVTDLDRAITDAARAGPLQVITARGKDRILGATLMAEHAGDVMAEMALAMKHKLGLGAILGTVHAYPTLSEANRFVAGNWRRAHAPAWAMSWLNRFHRWRR